MVEYTVMKQKKNLACRRHVSNRPPAPHIQQRGSPIMGPQKPLEWNGMFLFPFSHQPLEGVKNH